MNVLNMPLEEIVDILKHDEYPCETEDDVWILIRVWLNHNRERLRFSEKIIQTIRFGLLKDDTLKEICCFLNEYDINSDAIEESIDEAKYIKRNISLIAQGNTDVKNLQLLRPRLPRELTFFLVAEGLGVNKSQSVLYCYDNHTDSWVNVPYHLPIAGSPISMTFWENQRKLVIALRISAGEIRVMAISLTDFTSVMLSTINESRLLPWNAFQWNQAKLVMYKSQLTLCVSNVRMEFYECLSNKWDQKVLNVQTGDEFLTDPCIVASENEIYCIGGSGGFDTQCQIRAYDENRNSFRRVSALPFNCCIRSGCFDSKGRLVISSYSENNMMLHEYNTITGQLSLKTNDSALLDRGRLLVKSHENIIAVSGLVSSFRIQFISPSGEKTRNQRLVFDKMCKIKDLITVESSPFYDNISSFVLEGVPNRLQAAISMLETTEKRNEDESGVYNLAVLFADSEN